MAPRSLLVLLLAGVMFLSAGSNSLSVAYVPAATVSSAKGGPTSQPTDMVEGVLNVIWGDPGAKILYVLHNDTGDPYVLSPSSETPVNLMAYNRHRVRVSGFKAEAAMTVTSIEAVESQDSTTGGVSATLSGAQNFVNIQLRWESTGGSDPETAAWVDTMMDSSSWPSINHFYTEASFNTISIASDTVGPYNMPHDASWYTTNYPSTYLDKIFDDAVALADAVVNYPSYHGINLLFNGDIDGYAWGGTEYTYLDGQWKSYATTWEPPWGYTNSMSGGLAVIAHEIGHGFGLQHSGDAVGGWNSQPKEYSSCWDLMSWGGRSPCANAHYDSTYSYLPTHMIAEYKDELGWIPADKITTLTSSIINIRTENIQLFPLDSLSGSWQTMMVKIMMSTTTWYTVELRRRPNPSVLSSSYDNFVPTRAVIIHSVDTTRSDQAAMIIDIDANGNPNDAGAEFLLGNTFKDATNGIKVTVLGDGPSGSIYLKVDFLILNYLAVRGGDGKVYHDWFSSSSESYWQPTPSGSTIDGPAIVACGGKLHYVVRGGSNALYYANLDLSSGAFSGWSLLGGSSPSKPALTKDWTTCTLYLVVRGSTNGIHLKIRSSGGSWGGWITLPGSTALPPSVAYLTYDGSLHLLVRGLDSKLYHGRRSSSGTWLGWSLISGATPSGPALAATSSNSLLLVVRGSDNKVYTRWWTSSSGWGSWEAIPTGLTNDQPAVVCITLFQDIVVVKGTDGKIYYSIATWPVLIGSSPWSTWHALPGSTPSSPSITS